MSVRILVADTETTGFPPLAKVVEVCWYSVNETFDVLDKKHSLINPGIPIPAQASKVHGIFDDDVVDAPELPSYMSQHVDAGGNELILCCHNTPFDIQFLGMHLPEGLRTICTLALSKEYYPKAPNHKLTTMVDYLGLERGEAHSADGDVYMCWQLLRHIAGEHNLSIDDMAKQSVVTFDHMPFGKHKGTKLEDVPVDYLRWALAECGNLQAGLRKRMEEIC